MEFLSSPVPNCRLETQIPTRPISTAISVLSSISSLLLRELQLLKLILGFTHGLRYHATPYTPDQPMSGRSTYLSYSFWPRAAENTAPTRLAAAPTNSAVWKPEMKGVASCAESRQPPSPTASALCVPPSTTPPRGPSAPLRSPYWSRSAEQGKAIAAAEVVVYPESLRWYAASCTAKSIEELSYQGSLCT